MTFASVKVSLWICRLLLQRWSFVRKNAIATWDGRLLLSRRLSNRESQPCKRQASFGYVSKPTFPGILVFPRNIPSFANVRQFFAPRPPALFLLHFHLKTSPNMPNFARHPLPDVPDVCPTSPDVFCQTIIEFLNLKNRRHPMFAQH